MTEVNLNYPQHHMFNWNLIDKLSPKVKPPMSTPDDPVIHNNQREQQESSPQSGGYCPQSDSRSSCDSPGAEGAEGSAEERSRRNKTCRVCNDHATGYNFNVITCESCKAFFRRNALRPKEFKCPYSDDCDINAVSRRFCQKCRLKKCFAVGMKKEWILNDEQLRRRKNSRLNSVSSQRRQIVVNQSAQILQSPSKPMTILSPEQLQFGNNSTRLEMTPPMISPDNTTTYPLAPPAHPIISPITPPSNLPTPTSIISDYEPNLLLQQRFAQQRLSCPLTRPSPIPISSPPIASPSANRVNVDPVRNQVTMSVDEYNQLIQMASNRPIAEVSTPPATLEEPPVKRLSMDASAMQSGRPYSATITTQSLGNGAFASYTDLNPGMDQMKGMGMERMATFFDQTIIDALNVDSPDGPPNSIGGTRPASAEELPTNEVRANYQLNIAELRELDVVRAAFSGMNDPLDNGKQKFAFMKDNKTPTDIMNIMDITMRRLVKMAKKLPIFNEMTQDGKFTLLKGGMVEMLTVRGVTRYDEQSGGWHTPTLPAQYQVPIKMFDSLKEGVRDVQKERFLQFFRVLNEDLRKNELAIDLLMLIVLFKPRPGVQDPNDRIVVERQHNDFTALLHRYLESLYGDESRRFNEMIPKALKMLEIISSNTAMLFMGKVNKEEAEALPKEFFPVE
ncbi:unnamed protein product, partial [Mesorhabditis belari]|uniref:Uncharacterized protein n=1 Tax=Mesorhabditis belari TaxID=2138241 RepID=A0AAF3FJR3_9BILA